MTRISCVLFLLVLLPRILSAAEITELPLGTSGARAFIIHDTISEEPFIITDDLEYTDLSTRLRYYFDEHRVETPESLMGKDFLPTEGRVSWGFKDAACWFAFDYRADVSEPKSLNLKVLVTGFPLTVEPGERGTVYIYLDYPAGILSHARLYSADLFRQKANTRLALNALILGMNLALLLYNIVIFIWTRERVFLYFVLFLSTFTLHIYLREDYISSLLPFLRDYYFSMPPFVFAVLFTRSFLETKKTAPYIDRVLSFFLILGLLFAVLQVVGFRSLHIVQVVANLYKIFIALLAVCLGVILSLRKNKIGFLYLISWLPIIVSNFILQFEQMGMLQTNGPVYYFIVREGFYASGIFQAALLSITLADKINIFRFSEESARREAENLKDLDRKKTDFLMNVSHELRTPLTLILGTVDNVISGKYGTSISHTHRAFDVLRRNTSRLLFMINNLLNTTVLDRNKGELKIEYLSLDGYLRFLFSEFESLAEMKKVRLTYKNEAESTPIVKVDSKLLEIIFLNLFSNAFKFVPPEGNIDVCLESSRGECLVRIHNSGPSIESEELDRIFERFYRTDEVSHRKYEGIGIGLSLVKDAIHELDGRIQARNHPSGGVEFIVTLPRVRASGELTKAYPGSTAMKIVKDSLGKAGDIELEVPVPMDLTERPSVLLVEDNEDLQFFLSSELQSYFTLKKAGNGIEALDLIHGGLRPQLIISDIMMPGMDGREFYEIMRTEGFKDIPFLFLTARASEDEKISALETGAIDYLYKPFLPKELLTKALNIIEQNRSVVATYKHDLKERILKTFEDDSFSGARENRAVILNTFTTQYRLSAREKDVVDYLLKGMPDKEIAMELDIAVSTVSNTLHRVYRKAGISGRVELFRLLSDYSG